MARKSRKRRSPYGNWGSVGKTVRRTSIRRKMPKKCFLLPRGIKKNSYKPMFPVCNKSGKYDCGGIRAARTRASQWKYSNVKSKANKLGKKLKCSWAKMGMSGKGRYGFSGGSDIGGQPYLLEEELIAVRRSPYQRKSRKQRKKSKRKSRKQRKKSKRKSRKQRKKSKRKSRRRSR